MGDNVNSYKGFVSLVVLGFCDHGYIIDALALHACMQKLRDILEDPEITKMCMKMSNVMETSKR